MKQLKCLQIVVLILLLWVGYDSFTLHEHLRDVAVAAEEAGWFDTYYGEHDVLFVRITGEIPAIRYGECPYCHGVLRVDPNGKYTFNHEFINFPIDDNVTYQTCTQSVVNMLRRFTDGRLVTK